MDPQTQPLPTAAEPPPPTTTTTTEATRTTAGTTTMMKTTTNQPQLRAYTSPAMPYMSWKHNLAMGPQQQPQQECQ